jgi:hypothetical protein
VTRALPLVAGAVLASLVLTLTSGPGTAGATAAGPAAADVQAPPVTPAFEAERLRVEPPTGTFVGIDGVTYDSAPTVVEGLLDGELFYGPDFDVACGIGAGYINSMKAMTRLARTIAKSGRRVVWTGAPSKTSVLMDSLDTSLLPHGRCDRRGLNEQRRLIDGYPDPHYLQLRRKLANDPRQVYWRTDPHWTSVGGAVFAKSLASTLDPRIGRRQHYTLGTETRVGLFNQFLDDDTPETLQTALPRTSVRTRTARKSVEDYTGYPDIVLDHSWRSSPARKTWPGRTVLLGDSMMLFALANMRPIFRHGRFMWVEHVDVDDVVKAIVRADTVVLEVLQTFLPLTQVLVTKSFRRAVAKALRRDAR